MIILKAEYNKLKMYTVNARVFIKNFKRSTNNNPIVEIN